MNNVYYFLVSLVFCIFFGCTPKSRNMQTKINDSKSTLGSAYPQSDMVPNPSTTQLSLLPKVEDLAAQLGCVDSNEVAFIESFRANEGQAKQHEPIAFQLDTWKSHRLEIVRLLSQKNGVVAETLDPEEAEDAASLQHSCKLRGKLWAYLIALSEASKTQIAASETCSKIAPAHLGQLAAGLFCSETKIAFALKAAEIALSPNCGTAFQAACKETTLTNISETEHCDKQRYEEFASFICKKIDLDHKK